MNMTTALLSVALLACACTTSTQTPGPTQLGAQTSSGGTSGTGASAGASGATGPQGPAGKDATADGSRLKTKHLVASDGYTSEYGLTDTQRNENCTFLPASDGQLRCLPYTLFAGFGGYSDTGCATQIAAAAPCAASKYAAEYQAGTTACAGYSYRVFQLAAKLADDALIYSGQPGTCNPVTRTAGLTYYAVGAEIAPTEFVAATIQ